MTTRTGPGSAAPDPILTITVIKAVANMSTAGTAQDPPIDIPAAAPHTIESSISHCYCRDTPHTRPS